MQRGPAEHVQDRGAGRCGSVDHRPQHSFEGEIHCRGVLQEQIEELLCGGGVERIGCQLRTQRTDLGREVPDRTHVVLGRAEGFHAITVRACVHTCKQLACKLL